jgi:citronellol/citronellal dehydrogenase
MSTLKSKTIIMSGGSRGIGLAIALRAAADGANVTLIAKTDTPHPSLPGTIHTSVAAIEQAGGQALAVVGDIRDDACVQRAVDASIEKFGGIDIVLNNASAIDLSKTASISMKRYDLMQDINARGTFLLSKSAIPALRRSAASGRDPHILTMSPPIDLRPHWAGDHLAYTIAKYAMSLTTLGLAEELRADGIAVNSLWPHTMIATAAVSNILGKEASMTQSRIPQIVADAAYFILTSSSRANTGNFYIDDHVLEKHGVTDLEQYRAAQGTHPLGVDLFLSE